MNPIQDEEDDVLARLEARLESVNGVISRLRERNAELESQLRDALSSREESAAQLTSVQEEATRLRDEAERIRSRQKQAATRIKTLLSQVEQMDLLTEG
jgi:chromosome segregation ATPase